MGRLARTCHQAATSLCHEPLEMTQDNISHALFPVRDIRENVNGQFLLYEVPGIKANPGITPRNQKHAVIEALIDAAAISVRAVEPTVRFQVCPCEFFRKDPVGKQTVPKGAQIIARGIHATISSASQRKLVDIGRASIFEIAGGSVSREVIEGVETGCVHMGRLQDMLMDEISIKQAG